MDSLLHMKSAIIQDGCIVGDCSVVSSNCEYKTNNIIVGLPARMRKDNVTWEL